MKPSKPKETKLPDVAPFGVVTAYRSRGDHLLQRELFEKALRSYDQVLEWNELDVRTYLGRSLAGARLSRYNGALADVLKAIELEPDNMKAHQIRAQTEYEMSNFETALILARKGVEMRTYPEDFAHCASHAVETIRECVDVSAKKVLAQVPRYLHILEKKDSMLDIEQPPPLRKSRMAKNAPQAVQEITKVDQQKMKMTSRMMASMYLGRMAHDKYFLTSLCQDPRLVSANKNGTKKLQDFARSACKVIESKQTVLRERRPVYAARAAGEEARKRLRRAREAHITRAQKQFIVDAQRLVQSVQTLYESQDTGKCLESAVFAMEQISRKPNRLLPDKEKFLHDLYNIVANAFLDQKRVQESMSEADREKRAFVFLGLSISREPSRDSIIRARPQVPRDIKDRIQHLERALTLSTKPTERCYLLHELSRLNCDAKHGSTGRFYAMKCQAEARASNQRPWMLNANFLVARSNVLLNNRPEARMALLEAASMARSFAYLDVAAFFDTCANVSTEGEMVGGDDILEQREKALVNLMQDSDLKSKAAHLFNKMSAVPVGRRFSVMPGVKIDDAPVTIGRRMSILPKGPQATKINFKSTAPLGFQDFDY